MPEPHVPMHTPVRSSVKDLDARLCCFHCSMHLKPGQFAWWPCEAARDVVAPEPTPFVLAPPMTVTVEELF